MNNKTLYYITSNVRKIAVAEKFLNPFGFNIVQKTADVVEIQSEDIEKIAIYKAKQAFEQLKHPLFVNDAGWYIPAYKGFPGPFMKYMGEWFAADDWLHLMSNKEDKRISFKEYICYIDETGYKTFLQEEEGHFLTEQRGKKAYQPLDTVITLSPDGKTIAECWDEGISPAGAYLIWKNMAEWVKEK
jgi:XTP/dITP diphosphohydrolase